MVTGCTRVATRDDAKAVEDLRLSEYLSANEFEMTCPGLLRWGEHDDEGVILGAWSGTELVSTLRGLVAADRATAEDVLTCTVDLGPTAFPALILGRGATRTSHRRQGLNALLRLRLLGAAISDRGSSIRSTLALPYAGASRLRLMQELGYRVTRPAQTWDPEAREISPALLAVLSGDAFPGAVERLIPLTASVARTYSWVGGELSMPKPLPSGVR